jgi:hypothetical protein
MSSGWELLHCANHPERIALERCEVCRTPLCAYCLFYTEDGQRLCATHAAEARARGVAVEEPAAYAGQLVGAQAGALRKQKRGGEDDAHLYKGNSNDLLSLFGVVLGLISMGMCCGAAYCMPVVGFVFSLIALFNAKDSYDPKRTRKFGVIGLILSGVWVLVIVACIALYSASLSTVFQTVRWGALTPYYQTTPWTPTATPTATPAPHADLSDAADVRFATPAPPAPF